MNDALAERLEKVEPEHLVAACDAMLGRVVRLLAHVEAHGTSARARADYEAQMLALLAISSVLHAVPSMCVQAARVSARIFDAQGKCPTW